MDDAEPYTDLPPRVGFRFRLRTLFVIVTCFCILIGYKAIRERRAADIVTRHNRLQDVIVGNIANLPVGASFRVDPGSAEDLRARVHWPSQAILENSAPRGGGTDRLTNYLLLVDVTGLLPHSKPDVVAIQLLDHFAKGIDKLGLKTRSDFVGPGNNLKRRSVWSSPGNEQVLIIDVEVTDAPNADVWIHTIDAQQLRVW